MKSFDLFGTSNRNFNKQFRLVEAAKLPLFLHCRGDEAAQDLLSTLTANRGLFRSGVVHSFDGRWEDAQSFLNLGLFIGLNGCSLRTDSNLEVVRKLPLNKIMIETGRKTCCMKSFLTVPFALDCPWCEIKPTHSSSKLLNECAKLLDYPSTKKDKWKSGGLVKGRNEPCNIVQICQVIAQVRGENLEEVALAIYENTKNVFFP